jgi:hypothetical protein
MLVRKRDNNEQCRFYDHSYGLFWVTRVMVIVSEVVSLMMMKHQTQHRKKKLWGVPTKNSGNAERRYITKHLHI